MITIQVENHALPYVGLAFNINAGSASDPAGREGVAYLTANMLLRGTRSWSREQLADELDFVGSTVGISVGNETSQVVVDCSTHNLPRLLELIHEILVEPSFPEAELEKLKRQTIAEVAEMKDSDSTAGKLYFGQMLFAGHPYEHPTRGYRSSLEKITRDDVVAFYRQWYHRANLIVGTAGDWDDASRQRVEEVVTGHLPEGIQAAELPDVAPAQPGLDVLLVTHAERTQAQVLLGHPGIRGNDPRLIPVGVAVTGFGGTFTSLLVREIREKRGWSYGVGAVMVPGRHTGIFLIRYAPRNEDVVPAIHLTLELMTQLQKEGLAEDNFQFAQQYLVNQFPFMIDTPVKRMELELNVLLSGKPADYIDTYVDGVRSVRPDQARRAVAEVLTPDSLRIVVVGDESLEKALRTLPDIRRFRKIPYDWEGPLPD